MDYRKYNKLLNSKNFVTPYIQEEQVAATYSRAHKGKSIIDFPKKYIVADIETTGLNTSYNEIIELSALKVVNDKIEKEFSTLIQPKRKIKPFITRLTGITNEMAAQGISISQALEGFIDFTSDNIIVGHNVNFDINFIYDKLYQYKGQYFTNNFIDSLRISRRLLPHLRNHKLSTIAEHFSLDQTGMHRGLKDCFVTYNCFLGYKETAIDRYGSWENFLSTLKPGSNRFVEKKA